MNTTTTPANDTPAVGPFVPFAASTTDRLALLHGAGDGRLNTADWSFIISETVSFV